MLDGSYKTGNKFLNSQGLSFSGNLLKSLILADDYKAFGEFLDLPDIIKIHFEDLNNPTQTITDDDIKDLEWLDNYSELIRCLIEKGVIPDDQIKNYKLECFVAVFIPSRGYNDGDFPENPVKNMTSLQRHITRICDTPNDFVQRKITHTVWMSSQPFEKNYPRTEYPSAVSGRYFCQMCKKAFDNRYIERNEIESEPKFAWEQMILSLCLHCSKDYILLRNNKKIREDFIDAIMNQQIGAEGTYEIPIGDKSITFTATHLAEVQEIFKWQLKSYGDWTPPRT